MTTIGTMVSRAQKAIGDSGAGTWAAATVKEWLIDGIGDYSQYFKRYQEYSYTLQSGDLAVHDYRKVLPGDCQHIVQVEYPTGQSPPAYLVRRDRTHEQFYDYEGYYDFQPVSDASDTPLLYLSEGLTTGYQFTVWYLTYYAGGALDDAATLTVPFDHEGLLILFVIWRAFKERASVHVQDPDTTSDILQKMVNAANLAEQEYRRAIRQAERSQGAGGYAGPWRVDIHDPIY